MLYRRKKRERRKKNHKARTFIVSSFQFIYILSLNELEDEGGNGAKGRGLDVEGSARGRGGASGGGRVGARVGAVRGGSEGNGGGDGGTLALVRVTTDDSVLLEVVPSRAVEVLRVRVDKDTTLDNGQGRKGGIVKAADKVNGTADLGNFGETENGRQVGVVGNLETTANGGEGGEGNVGEALVGDNGERATNGLELGALDAPDGVVGEGQGGVDGGNVEQGDSGNVTEGHVVGPGEVGEGQVDVGASGGEVKNVGNVVEVKVQGGQVSVVVNVEGLNSLKVDTIEGGDGGVGDDEGLGGGDTGVELEVVELVEGDKGDVASRGQLGEGDGADGLENLEGKGTRNVDQVGGRYGGEGGDVADNQVTVEDLDTLDGGGVELALKGNITRELGAGRNGIQVGLGVDGDRVIAGRGGGLGPGAGGGGGNKQGLEEHCEDVRGLRDIKDGANRSRGVCLMERQSQVRWIKN